MPERQCSGSSENAEIEDAVIRYLRNHPNAADTVDGIANWWLPQQRYETACAQIRQVLVHLVEVGVVRIDNLPGGDELYALNDNAEMPPRTH